MAKAQAFWYPTGRRAGNKDVPVKKIMRQFAGFSAVMALMALVPAMGAVAQQKLNSTNYTIDASVGNTFGGQASSASYKLVSSGGEPIIGNGAGGSYMMGEGYVAQLAQALQLTVQPNGLVAYYPLEENLGTRAHDETANSYTGTLQASPGWVAGKVGKALSFNGTTQYVSLPDVDIATNITVEAWVNPSAATQTSKIISKQSTTTDAQGSLGLSAGKAQFEITTNGTNRNVVSTTTLSTGSWTHIAGTYDGANAKIYVNGILETTVAATGAIANNNFGWAIGRLHAAGNSDYYTGSVDQVKVFDRSLTLNEIKAEYDAGAAGSAAGIAFANNLIAGTPQTLAAKAIIQTDAPGYSLALAQNANLTSGGNTIAAVDNGGTIATPAAWTDGTTKGLGFTLTSGLALPAKWGTNPNYAYAAVPGSATTFYSRTGYAAGTKDALTIQYKLDVPAAQAVGAYTNTVTYTGTLTP